MSQVISNLMMFGLGMVIVGFIWSFISNVDSEDKVKFTTPRDLPQLMTQTKYEKETGHIIRVEVLNGCGVSKLAAMYTDFLRDEGVDVLKTGNANRSDYEKTVIIHRQGKREISEEIAGMMGINPESIILEPDPGSVIDATIILGRDYDSIGSFHQALKFRLP